MILNFIPFWLRLVALMIISFTLVYLGEKDASTSSAKYNSISWNDSLSLLITKKHTEEVSIPPKFTFTCTNMPTNDTVNLIVSRGEYEASKIGNVILAFKTTDNKYMTKYEIDNQMIIVIGDKGYSFVFIPVIVFLLIGFTCLYYLIRKFVTK